MRRVTILLAAAALVAVATTSTASAQARPACNDGVGNVKDQVRGSIIDAILPDWVIDHPWGPEAPADLWGRCMDPYLGPVPGPGSNSGEPHIVTQDGLAYDLQAAGDVVLLATDDDRVEIQARYVRDGAVTWVGGVAVGTRGGSVTVGGDVDPGSAPRTVAVDGEPVDLGPLGFASFDGGIVFVDEDTTEVLLDDGAGLRVVGRHVDFYTPPDWAATFRGVMGNGNGDPTDDVARRDGAVIDPTDTDMLYGLWLDDWLVAPGDSLFPTPFDESWGPTRPDEVVTLADLPPADVAAAAARCRAAGWTTGAGLEQCTFDVAVTGDERLADERPATADVPMVPVAALEPTVDVAIDLTGGDEVGPDQPVPGAGRIEGPNDADDHRLAATDGKRWLVPTQPCSAPLAAVAYVMVDDGPPTILPLTCGAAHPLPRTAVTLRVVDPSGLGRDYGFRISPTPDPVVVPSTVDATVGEPVDLVVSAPTEVASARLSLTAGQRIFVETLAELPGTVALDGPDGERVASWAPFLDSGVIVIAVDGEYVLSHTPVQELTGTLTALVHDVPDDVVESAAVGDEVSLDVAGPGQLVSVTLDLAAGDTIEVATLESVPGMFVLVAPDGTPVPEDGTESTNWPPFLGSGPRTATVSGMHTITYDAIGANVGPITFWIDRG